MPFPLAHPAAVLPLRKLCPRRLDFEALLLASLVPDFTYALDDLHKFWRLYLQLFGPAAANHRYVIEQWDWDDFAHTLPGGLLVCLPLSVIALLVYRWLKPGICSLLPNPHGTLLGKTASAGHSTAIIWLPSLLIGIGLHLVWDGFTNDIRWLGAWDMLHRTVATINGQPVKLYRFLWFVSSIGGIVALAVSYLRFLARHGTGLLAREKEDVRKIWCWFAGAVAALAIAAIPAFHFEPNPQTGAQLYHFTHRLAGFALVFFGFGIIAASARTRLIKPVKS